MSLDRSLDRPPPASTARSLAIPALLAAISLVGLVSALIGDDVWDILSWTALATPLAVILRYVVCPPVAPNDGARRG
jgi:hypothetical protein